MRSITMAFSVLAAVTLAGLSAGCASKKPFDHPNAGKYLYSATPVNTLCPVGKEAHNDAAGGTARHKGFTVAFCCEGCAEFWPSLDEDQKDEFVELALQDRDGEFDPDS